MRIFLTGATGKLGSRLVASLINRGHEIIALTREAKENASHMEWRIGDVTDFQSIASAFKDLRADVILHLAAVTHAHDQKEYDRVNVYGTENMIRAAVEFRVPRFLLLSSRVASKEGGAYAHSKIVAEEAVTKSSLSWLIIRPAEVYGINNGEAISRLCNIVRKSPIVPIVGNGEYTLSPVYIDDAMNAILVAIEKTELHSKIYTLAGETMTFNALVGRITHYFNKRSLMVHVPLWVWRCVAVVSRLCNQRWIVADQIPRLLCKKSDDSSVAIRDLGFKPRSLEEGIKNLYQNLI